LAGMAACRQDWRPIADNPAGIRREGYRVGTVTPLWSAGAATTIRILY
jgi:hypothetical protein